MLFLLSSPLSSICVSVVFVFNASPIDVAPLSPMMLSVDLVRMEGVGWLTNAIFVLFLLPSLFRSSFVSVVFVFNASLNDVASVSPILLSVDLIRMESVF